jgi:prepilin-type N-terminal cleavage/methylation domain-containing protein
MRITSDRSARTCRRGFSLVELSIVVAIMSVVMVLGLEGAASFIGRTAYRTTQDKLTTADTAIDNFLHVYGRLPCPADRTLAPTNSSYGFENCSLAVYSGTTILGGALPFRTLNMPLNASLDGYGSKFQYIVTQGLTAASSYIATTESISVRTGLLQQPCSTICETIGNAAYAVYSFGADQRGAVSKTGALEVGCLTGTSANTRIDAQNCYNTQGSALAVAVPGNVIYDSRYNTGSIWANYDDDILLWHPKNQL